MLMATRILVITPVISTASWLFLWLMNINVTRKMSQPSPDVAQPEWIPPRCCSTEVQARRNQRGDHCRKSQLLYFVSKVRENFTLANNVLTIKYKHRPKSSFRMRMATRRLPRTNAPVYWRGYVQTLVAASNKAIKLRVMVRTKNFLH